MAIIDWDLHYDRRATAGFLAHFLHGGVAESLAEYARYAPYPVDLQLRKNPKTGAEHATLYVGLTSVLQVTRIKGDLLRLHGHKNLAGKHHAFDPAWSNPMTAKELTPRWRAVEGYLEDVIPLASAKHANKEGAVQAAVSVFSTDERVMVDREVALTFKDTSTKTRIFEEITAPYLDAVKTVADVPGQHPTSFGGECDLLAVDARGRLLAVEIKPRNVSSIAWAGIQATIYAELFTRWLRSPRSAAADQPEVIIRDMLDQRTQLGLASPNRTGAPRRAQGGARRGNSTRLTGSFPRSPQICTQDHPRLTWLRRNQPGGLRSQHDRPASTTCPLITLSSRPPRCRPTTVGLDGPLQ